MSLSSESPSESSSEQTLSPLVESVCSALQQFTEFPSSLPFVVALSGGVDSTVLLHALVQLRHAGLISSLSAIHVHHGLSVNADSWAEYCQNLCRQWQVPLDVRRVDVNEALGDGIEQAARSMRYQVFEQLLPEQGCLLQGHHQDDQAETLLFRLFRGSGLDGLTGIPARRPLGKRGHVVRPLLSVSRASIEAYAKDHQLQPVEDESNTDQRFARNYLRQNLIPQIEQRWPGVSERLALLSGEVLENQQWQQQAVEEAADSVLTVAPDYWNAGQVVNIESLLKLSESMAFRVVRYWLKQKGLLMPDRSVLNTLFAEVIHSREDAEPVLQLGDYEVRRFDGLLVLVPVLEPFSDKVIGWNCESRSELHVPASGWLTLDKDSARQLKKVSVCFRHNLPGSEKVRVAGRQGSKSVKRWLQEYRVPPWLRDRVPFLFYNGQMLCAAGLWVCDLLEEKSGKKRPDEAGGSLDSIGIKVRADWRFDPY
ncbi:tRNA lysidine(34) synthetase TilS [Endozoicomonas lisbonensis]|uniref:tRNA(Ile)-lysidine synthase n=1 Tax=Endozoicomonas lisbonensis TaxID=3120522 RepID=A0ABV2SMW7_9GAMM